jgi:putative ABC transport system ATP-binding protein
MIALRDVYKSYTIGNVQIPALRGVSLTIGQGEFVAITGPSGSGKSTLMNICGLLEGYDSGSYEFLGHEVGTVDEESAAYIRNTRIGFVFQLFNLIPRLNALRNVELPLVYSGERAAARQKKARIALEIVGLADRMLHKPSQLSGGQQQRVAIARSLVTNPDLIIADEPTGSLDSDTSHEIMQLFVGLNNSGKTIIMVTHEDEIAAYARRVIHLRDGLVKLDTNQ